MGNRKRFGCKKDIISVFFLHQNNFFRALTFSTHAPPCSSPSPKTRFISLQTFLISAFSFFISAPTYFTPGKTSESKLCRSGMSSATSLGTTVSYTLCIKIWPKEKTRTLNSTSLVARNGKKYMHFFFGLRFSSSNRGGRKWPTQPRITATVFFAGRFPTSSVALLTALANKYCRGIKSLRS